MTATTDGSLPASEIPAVNQISSVAQIIDESPLSRFQIVTMLICGLVLLLDGFDTQSIGFLAPSMSATLHIPLKNFGPVFGAALFGLMISSMVAGPVADRVGRKWPIVISTLTFSTFACLTPFATIESHLILLRFITGLGLGGAIPNVVALASEYAPRRLVKVFVTVLFCGMPLGTLLGGIVSSVMLPRWGWQSVFFVGGVPKLLIVLILITVLPESVRFLSVRGSDPRKIARIMARISPEFANLPLTTAVPTEEKPQGLSVKHLFMEGRAVATILLWIPFFMNLLILYSIVSWLPALMRQTGLPLTAGITAVSLFSLGGVFGSLSEGALMNKWGSFWVLLIEFVLCTAFIGSLAFVASLPIMLAATFLLGFAVQGAQGGLNAISASFYPTAIRSTGVGWALGVGRIGSIVGPVIGGALLTLNWAPRQIFLAGAIPALFAAAAIILSIALSGYFSSAFRPSRDPS